VNTSHRGVNLFISSLVGGPIRSIQPGKAAPGTAVFQAEKEEIVMSNTDFLSGSRADTVIRLPHRGNVSIRTTVVILFALALIAGANWIMSDSALQPPSAAAQAPAPQADAVYYPSVYVNQGTTEPTEPIPTF
jgi:hypothetical protein